MFFWNIDQTEPRKFDVDLDAKEEVKSDVKPHSKNIDVIYEISSFHWIDIKKICADWSNSQIKIRIEKQVLVEKCEEVCWEDIQKQIENIKIEWCSDSSNVNLTDSINGTK